MYKVSVDVMLNEYSKAIDFVNEMSKLPYNVDVVSGRYTLNAKSTMGIFSLDLSKPVTVVAELPEQINTRYFLDIVEEFK